MTVRPSLPSPMMAQLPRSPYCDALLGRVDQGADHVSLSDREIEIVRLMGQHLTNAQIGERLFLAPTTIKWYTRRIYEKLGVHKRGEAVDRARAQGLA